MIRLEQSGSIQFTFNKIDEELIRRNVVVGGVLQDQWRPLQLICYCKSNDGAYRPVTGIAIFLEKNEKYRLNGVPAGVCKCELKESNDSDSVYWSSDNVLVTKGCITELNDLSAVGPK